MSVGGLIVEAPAATSAANPSSQLSAYNHNAPRLVISGAEGSEPIPNEDFPI
jgi:hypothetical protein